MKDAVGIDVSVGDMLVEATPQHNTAGVARFLVVLRFDSATGHLTAMPFDVHSFPPVYRLNAFSLLGKTVVVPTFRTSEGDEVPVTVVPVIGTPIKVTAVNAALKAWLEPWVEKAAIQIGLPPLSVVLYTEGV